MESRAITVDRSGAGVSDRTPECASGFYFKVKLACSLTGRFGQVFTHSPVSSRKHPSQIDSDRLRFRVKVDRVMG